MRLACGSASGALLLGALLFGAKAAQAQPNLPPPPPPPLGTDPPPSTTRPPPRQSQPPPQRATPQPRESQPDRREWRDEWVPPSRRDWTVRFNPLALALLRVSADVEWLFYPHHALVVSPHLTLQADRGDLPAKASGFAGPRATGFGAEIGYHYYLTGAYEPEGIFLGPSLLLDSTLPAPNASRFLSYGGAFDIGYQVVLASGFTIGGGAGLFIMKTANVDAALGPRFLLGVGWSF